MVRKVSFSDLVEVAKLLDAYRVFYQQKSDLQASKQFINERLNKQDSYILVSEINGELVGFTQLYYTFSSVTLQRSLILNDLYVYPNHRNKGIGKALLLAAQDYAIDNGFKGLALETGKENIAARLYEKLGWQEEVDFRHYFWLANPKIY